MISLDNVSKAYGKQLLFMETSATVNRGEKVGLVGPNGAGKSTLFRMITGEEEPDGGRYRRSRRHYRLFLARTGEMPGWNWPPPSTARGR